MTHNDAMIQQAAGGCREAFAALVKHYYPLIFKFAVKCCGHPCEAEDIAQDVCIKLARAIRSYEHRGYFTTWLYTLTLNAVRDAARVASRERARRESLAGHLAVERECRTGEDTANDIRREVHAMLEELPPAQREAVVLVYWEGLNHREAADICGCKESTISWRLHEARKTLRQWMEEDKEV